ncbi:MAG: hypothetical protein ACI81O_002356 [Cyclobacteriaceae bacterium]|jgi:hypothetical protein
MTICESMKKSITSILLISFSMISPTTFADNPGVNDLAWMTGAWSGPAGPDITLEENWIMPTGGSIASLVRMTGNGKTPMVELIVIEEEDDTLVLRIMQWNSGFSPRTPGPQTMSLAEIGENSVRFIAEGDEPMQSLMYSRPTDNSFNIVIETIEGEKIQIMLKAR